MRRTLIVSTLCCIFCAVFPAAGGEGRRPVWEPLSLGSGESGKFILTRNVTSSSGSAIEITGSGVEEIDIDLNGFTVGLAGGVAATTIRVENIRSFTIRNGRVENGVDGLIGVETETVDQVIVEDLKISGGRGAIRLISPRTFAIRRNAALDSAGDGTSSASIIVQHAGGPTEPAQGVIEDNLVRDGGFNGIYLRGFFDDNRSATLFNNRVVGAINAGIVAGGQGLIVSGNDVKGSGGSGIVVVVSRACQVTDNVSTDNGGIGIFLSASDNCRVFENNASGNDESGIRAGDSSRNLFTHNTVNNNGDAGLSFGSSADENTYGENTGRGNSTVTGPCASNPPACGSPQVCDDGTGNTTLGDNLLPDAC